MNDTNFSFGVVILAAGASTRMGRPKLLLPWGGTTVLSHIVAQWRALGAVQIAPVCRHDDPAIEGELRRLGFSEGACIINRTPEAGMFSSIKLAAGWNGWFDKLTHVAVALGDQPHISPETLAKLVTRTEQHPGAVCQPSFAGHPKHPVFFPAQIFRAVTTSPFATLKEYIELNLFERSFLEWADEGLNLDLDYPEEYEFARRKYAPPPFKIT